MIDISKLRLHWNLNIIRAFLALGVFLVVSFGLLYKYVSPGAYDPYWMRGAIALLMLTGLIGSYVNQFVKDYSYRYLLVLYYVGTFWFLFLVHQNQLSPNYSLGLMLVFLTIGIVGFNKVRDTLVYTAICLPVVAYVLIWTSDPQVNPEFFGSIILASIAGIVFIAATRAKKENQLEHQSRLLDRIFQLTEDVVVILNRQTGRIKEYNHSAEKLIGDQKEQLKYKNITTIDEPILQKVNLTEIREYFRSHQSAYKTYFQVTEAGSSQYWKLQCELIDSEDLLIVWLSDLTRVRETQRLEMRVTEQKKREKVTARKNKKLKKAKKAAEQSEELQANFLANMSHEIRNPIHIINGLLDVLDQSFLTPSQERCLNKINVTVNNLMVLVNDVLDYEQINKGVLELREQNFELKTCVWGTLDSYRLKAENKGLDFHLELSDDLPDYVEGDRVRFAQILSNLVGNAIKYTKEGGIRVSLERYGEQDSDSTFLLHLKVSDTGVGIPDEKKSSIFQPFSKIDNDYTNIKGSSGLGLSIVSKLINLHDGVLQLDSTPGEGSTFHVYLPLNKGERSGKYKKPENQHSPQGTASRILLVEDEKMGRFVMKKINQRIPIKIDMARNGREAIDMAEKGQYDMILMDIKMPEMDGITATRILRTEYPDYRNTPIIAVTGYANKRELKKIRNAGMDDYLTKPYNKNDLYTLIEKYLESPRQDNGAFRHQKSE